VPGHALSERCVRSSICNTVSDTGLGRWSVEHDVELVMNLSDHGVVMHQGAKLAEGPPLQVCADPAVQAAYFGDMREANHA
jgi:branched-chain amino acid transport system ATP-binding protein